MKQNYTIPRGVFEGVEVFLRVADRRSFRQAAADLGLTPSAVSQAVRALEAKLGVALLTRTTRSVGLTEAGARFLQHARPAFDEVMAGGDAARDLAEKPSGLLRISVPRAAIAQVLQPLIASFCRTCPQVTVELSANEQLVDLAAEGFDAGIRMGQFLADDVVAIRLTPPFRLAIVGSPDYFARHGRPKTPSDLAQQACARIRSSNGALAPWRLRVGKDVVETVVSGPLIANDFPTLASMAVAGVVLAQVPEPITREPIAAGRLEEVLRTHAPETPGLFLYFPNRRQVLPKLRAFIDHVRAGSLSG